MNSLLRLMGWLTDIEATPKWKKWGMLLSWLFAGGILRWCWGKW